MTDSPNYSHYVVQTLIDTQWRSFERYPAEKPAQDIAHALIEEWGAQRVRILGGFFAPEKDRNVYYRIALAAPRRFLASRGWQNSKFIFGSTALGVAMLAIFLIFYSVILPIASVAADGKGPETMATSGHSPIAPIAKPVDLRARFGEVAHLPYARIREMDTVPLRLRGPWGTACDTDGGELVLAPGALSHLVEGESRETLTSVWQTGQRYGLVQSDGSIRMMNLISADRLQMIGTMNRLGDFTADTSGAILSRCL